MADDQEEEGEEEEEEIIVISADGSSARPRKHLISVFTSMPASAPGTVKLDDLIQVLYRTYPTSDQAFLRMLASLLSYDGRTVEYKAVEKFCLLQASLANSGHRSAVSC